jgi:demethylmenaquinone methyltransferase/2-methoxy-6-polyprenyl-1,4-benzoquinol methylase
MTPFATNIQSMFSSIAPKYDLLNTVLSLGIDRYWRKIAVDELHFEKEGWILDVATGTADVALEVALRRPKTIKVFGADFSLTMLQLGEKKISQKSLNEKVNLGQADGEMLPCLNNSFDGVIVAFGIRNFSNLGIGLSEMWRVLKPEKKMVVLEFSIPKFKIFRLIYILYFNYLLPFVGKIISGHEFAYQYLPESVSRFPSGDEMVQLIEKAGFKEVKCIPLTFGIASIYTGFKNGKI